MYATKQARQYKEKHPEADIYIFYMDIRAFGKGYEEFYESASENFGIQYVRGRIAEVREGDNNNIVIRAEDTLLQQPIELEVELFVLSCGLEARADGTAFITDTITPAPPANFKKSRRSSFLFSAIMLFS